MTRQNLAERILDPAYRQRLVNQAKAGTLPEDVEDLLWELADHQPARRYLDPAVATLLDNVESKGELGDWLRGMEKK